MNGDEVLNVMGNPDKIETLESQGNTSKVWVWSYNILKKFERASDGKDINVTVYFDSEGKVKTISGQNVK